MTATVRPSGAAAAKALRLAAGAYILGLALWLGLGLLPEASVWVPSFGHLCQSLATGHGVLSLTAARVLAAGSEANGSLMHAMPGMSGPTGSVTLTDLLVQYLFSAVNLALGILLAVRRFNALVPRLMAFGLLGTAATFNQPSHAVFHVIGTYLPVTLLHFTFHIVSGVTYLWAVVLFPDGRLPRTIQAAWARRALLTVTTAAITVLCWQSSFLAHPPFFMIFFGIIVAVAGVVAQSARLRRPAAAEARQQARVLRAALVPALVLSLCWLLAHIVGLAGGPATMWAAGFERSAESFFPAVFVIVPVCLFAAILKLRLWDLDVIISRTLLYGSLTAVVSTTYITAVLIAGSVADGGPVTALVAMTLVGVAVTPARARLDVLANRLVFGQSLTPNQAMRRLAEGLERLTPAEELHELTHVVVAATRAATSARVWLLAQDQLVAVAQWPGRQHAATTEPLKVGSSLNDGALMAAVSPCDHALVLHHQGRPLGVLAIAARPDLGLAAEEKRLIRDLADHAGLLVHNAQLAAELARRIELLSEQADNLRHSRQQVVQAQDAARQQLERDIHDGAQQDLVALIVALRALRNRPAENPCTAEELEQLRSLVRSTDATLSDLCGTGLPAAFARGGLSAALESAAAAARRAQVIVEVDLCVPTCTPPDVERAVYFCCVESLQNSVKHASANRIIIEVSAEGDDLCFSVSDDGVGFDAAKAARSSGLANMAERLIAIGGTLSVLAAQGRGTQVRGRIPIAPSTERSRSAPAAPIGVQG